MKPVLGGCRQLVELETVGSTQTELCQMLREGRDDVGAVLAAEQTAGRGRFGREWISPKGTCLAVSLALFEYADWPRPELIGMAAALAVAEGLDILIQWPNDLVIEVAGVPRKVGGVLTEVVPTDRGMIPVVGIGANLKPGSFPPEIARHATSLLEAEGRHLAPRQALDKVLSSLERVPEPAAWSDLASRWAQRDRTPGKAYKLPDKRICIATGINADGHLVGNIGSERVEVPSAHALL